MLRFSWGARLTAKGCMSALPYLAGFSLGGMTTPNDSRWMRQRRTVLATTLVLAFGMLSSGIGAQSSDSVRTVRTSSDERSHTVKPGDTLWALAEQYLGDGLLWRSIARRNAIPVTSAAIVPIKVGQLLVIPPRSALPDAVAASSAGELVVPQMALAPALRDTAASAVLHIDQLLAERAKRRVGLVTSEEYALAKDSGDAETVFRREVPSVESAERKAGILLAGTTATPRRAEFESAPFDISKELLAGTGRVLARIGSDTEGRVLRMDRIEIAPPRNGRYRVGDRLVVVRLADDWGRRVAVPTGVVEVVTAPEGKAPVQAVVRAQVGSIEPGQRLVAALGDPAPRNAAVRLSTPDISTTVVWLDQSENIPTLQSFVLLGAGEPQGVKAGDEFALYMVGARRQEQLIATVRVVRVVGTSSAAVMTRQYAPGIKPGVIARRFARTP